jgi:sigma-B regulation protein RsbU (phosphoserine phosphatase)
VTQKNKISEKIKVRNFKLKTLLDVTNAINENASKKDLFNIFEKTLTEHLGIKKLILITDADGKWTCEIATNQEIKEENIKDILLILKNINSIEVIRSSENDFLNGFDIVVPISHKNKPLAYLLLGDLYDDDELEMSPIIKHLPFIQTISNIITVAIQNKILYKKSLEQAAFKRELELAAKMQQKLVPANLPQTTTLKAAGMYIPFKEVGGDYYDLIKVSDNEYFVCIADVSGKGISAAILMSNFQAKVRALVQTKIPIKSLILELNKQVYDLINGEKFITFFGGYLNIENQTLTYVNCGHHAPLFVCRKTVRMLDSDTTMLGVFPEIPDFEPQQLIICPPCKLFLYTDGLMDYSHAEYAPFSYNEINSLLIENEDKSVNEIIQLLHKKIEEKSHNQVIFQDDITVLMLQFL